MAPQKKYPANSFRDIMKEIENPKPKKTGEEIVIETLKGIRA